MNKYRWWFYCSCT